MGSVPAGLILQWCKHLWVQINTSRARFDSTCITLFPSTNSTASWVNYIQFKKAYNVNSYSRLTFYGSFLASGSTLKAQFRDTGIGSLEVGLSNGATSCAFNIAQIISLLGNETFYMFGVKDGTYVNRIALS